jgi:hypothetical protein
VVERTVENVRRDLARGYITERAARETYGLSEQQIAEVLERVLPVRIHVPTRSDL